MTKPFTIPFQSRVLNNPMASILRILRGRAGVELGRRLVSEGWRRRRGGRQGLPGRMRRGGRDVATPRKETLPAWWATLPFRWLGWLAISPKQAVARKAYLDPGRRRNAAKLNHLGGVVILPFCAKWTPSTAYYGSYLHNLKGARPPKSHKRGMAHLKCANFKRRCAGRFNMTTPPNWKRCTLGVRP